VVTTPEPACPTPTAVSFFWLRGCNVTDRSTSNADVFGNDGSTRLKRASVKILVMIPFVCYVNGYALFVADGFCRALLCLFFPALVFELSVQSKKLVLLLRDTGVDRDTGFKSVHQALKL
jgi:hypothetical protein